MSAGMSSTKEASSLLLPAAVTNRMPGALAKALVSASFWMSKYSRAIALRSSGVLPMLQSSSCVLDALHAAAPAHVDDAHALLLEEVDVGLRVLRVAQRELARRARIGEQVPVEFDAADDQARIRIAGDRDAGDVRSVHPVAGEADLLDERLVLVRLERRHVALDLARLGAVDVRLQVGEALEARLQLRHLALAARRGSAAARLRRLREAVERDDRHAAVRGREVLWGTAWCRRRCPIPRSSRARSCAGGQRHRARGPDVGLVDLVRGEIGRQASTSAGFSGRM